MTLRVLALSVRNLQCYSLQKIHVDVTMPSQHKGGRLHFFIDVNVLVKFVLMYNVKKVHCMTETASLAFFKIISTEHEHMILTSTQDYIYDISEKQFLLFIYVYR